jgi:putative membrane protein
MPERGRVFCNIKGCLAKYVLAPERRLLPWSQLITGDLIMRKSTIVLVACLGSVLAGASALSVANNTEDKAAMGKPTSATFVKKASEANLAEVETGKLGASRAQSPEVKKFAEQMVKDHTKAGTELTTIAKDKSLIVSRSVGPEHKAAMESLKAKSGAEFDAAFMEQMKKDHDKAVALFTSASTADEVDPELQSFAKRTLPTLEHHQHMATELNTKMASASSSTTTSR